MQYDNEYGNTYKEYHDETDLGILKKNEKLITTKGGEYIGELYGFIITPALLENNVPLGSFLEAIIDMLDGGDLENNLNKYRSIYELAFPEVVINSDSHKAFCNQFPDEKKELIDIYKVLHSNYSIY